MVFLVAFSTRSNCLGDKFEVVDKVNQVHIKSCRQLVQSSELYKAGNETCDDSKPLTQSTAKRVQIMMTLFEVGNRETKFPHASTL